MAQAGHRLLGGARRLRLVPDLPRLRISSIDSIEADPALIEHLARHTDDAAQATFVPVLLALHGGTFALALVLLWWREYWAVLRRPWRRYAT